MRTLLERWKWFFQPYKTWRAFYLNTGVGLGITFILCLVYAYMTGHWDTPIVSLIISSIICYKIYHPREGADNNGK